MLGQIFVRRKILIMYFDHHCQFSNQYRPLILNRNYHSLIILDFSIPVNSGFGTGEDRSVNSYTHRKETFRRLWR